MAGTIKFQAYAPKTTIKIGSDSGLTAPVTNLQQTVNVQSIQNAAKAPTYQQATTTPLQSGNRIAIQRAATAAQVAAAAQAQRIAVANEVARQKAIRRGQVQGQVDSRVAANSATLKLKVSQARDAFKIRIGGNYAPGKINVPKYVSDDPEFDRLKARARAEALKRIDSMKGSNAKGFDKLIDKVTFGADRRASAARSFAEREAVAVADRQVKVYQQKLDAHNKLQASLQADYERQRERMSSADLNTLAAQYNARLEASVGALKRTEAYLVGSVEGYDSKAKAKLTSKPAAAAAAFNRNIVQKAASNPIWKYTLGEGSRNIPSVVTAPSRAINFLGNLNTQDRKIYKYGGEITSRLNSKDNAWQATLNQRNVNLKPVVDQKFDKATAWKELSKESTKTLLWRSKFEAAKDDKAKTKIAKEYWTARNRTLRNDNSAKEIAADPLNLAVGLGAATRVLKGTKYISKLTGKTAALKNSVGNNKIIKWLNTEAKSPEQSLSDAIDAAKVTQGTAQRNVLARIAQIDKKVSGGKVDLGVFDDLAKLTESEAKMLQRMKAGKLSPRDHLMLIGRGTKPVREKLMRIAARWDDFTEQMKLADNVQNTSYGKGKRLYSPATAWTDGDLAKYNFRLKRGKYTQSKSDFEQGAVDRYLQSSVRQQGKAARPRLEMEREALLKRYADTVDEARATVTKAERKTVKLGKYIKMRKNGTSIEGMNAGKAAVNSARAITGAPMKLWKNSVLKYRPAWTVNNTLYNAQAGVLSGGAGYIPEQLKMLNPRYARKAMDEIPSTVRTDLAKEIGSKGKLNKFYAGVENNPRTAAFRALKKKGLSDEEALKRVDKYFFNYTTKNWERPLKTILPFWAWQKNLTKAAVRMPFDRPGAAIGYNRFDRQQEQTFEKDFETMVPALKAQGYSDADIEKMKEEQKKYFGGKLKVGGKYYNTPFNAFSEKGLTSMGFNPYLAAAGEASNSVDSFGTPIKGNEASLRRRLTTKFPQAELGYKWYKGKRVDKGLDKPSEKYIGAAGSEGYGMTKEKQGYDPKKANYKAGMDPRTKNKQDLAAFLGKPREMTFDKGKFVEGKKLQKVTAEYFSQSEAWKNMDFNAAEAERKKLFDKFGLSSDDFFKGILAKYDTDHTKKIKGLKEAAAAQNKSLFAEYAKQPKGTRNEWASDKLKELNKIGYFDDNPFLKSFKWVNKDSIAKAAKSKAVKHALATGDWSQYRKAYGSKAPSAKKIARDYAVKTGDWSAYRKKYGGKSTPYQTAGKYFKTATSMEKYKEGVFWQEYAQASKADRKKLLAKNSQYDRRANWTDQQWDDWKIQDKAKKLAKLKSYGNSGKIYDKALAANKTKAGRYKDAQTYRRRQKRVAYA